MASTDSIRKLMIVAFFGIATTGCLSEPDGEDTLSLDPGSTAGGSSSGGSSSGGSSSGGSDSPPPPPPSGDSSGKVEPVVLYSYDPELVAAAPVDGAEADPALAYFYLEPSEEWQQRGIETITYYCCEAIEGPDAGTPHGPAMSVSYEPWSLAMDLSAYPAGSVRRLEVVAAFDDGSISRRDFRFNIAGGEQPNIPPDISGTPPAKVVAEKTYSFTPDAADPDGDTIAFSITNKPSWASFDTVTGRLTGTPGINDIGEYGDITLFVSDGQSSDSLGPFSITVESIGMGSVTLSWTPPATREDGSPLTDLAGYHLFYGQSSREYTEDIRIDNPGVTSYTIENLNSGDWYFAMKSVDSSGLESDYSAEARRTVP